MSVGVIGYTGFVGVNLLESMKKNHNIINCFNSQNIDEISSHKFDMLYISAIQAKKWWANQNPIEDKRFIDELFSNLENVSAKKVVFISTVDVYQPPIDSDEDTLTNDDIHAYGKNRLYAEKRIKELFDDVHIIRLQGLVASNLSKNIIYDLKHKNILETINPQSKLQWYPLARLFDDIQVVIKNDISLINLSVEPLLTSNIIDTALLNSDEKLLVSSKPSASITYDVTSKYAKLFGGKNGYIVSAQESLSEIQSYFKCKD